jgi:amino-acid N-acetyltransferase
MPPIDPARRADFEAIVRLLEDARLPHADLTLAHLEHFLVLREGDAIVGVVGMEVRGAAGLLRSLAVEKARRGGGAASALVDALEARACHAGIRTLYLLTTTAEGFFARRGYAPAARAAVPDAIRQTPEFRGICPDSAACLSRQLDPAADAEAAFGTGEGGAGRGGQATSPAG